jgi:hypothetical protein
MATIHICGGKGHECDSNGPSVIVLDDNTEIPDTEENHEKYKKRIRGGSVTCSRCGKSALSQGMWLCK